MSPNPSNQDLLKVKAALNDPTFWVALLWSIVLVVGLLLPDVRGWLAANQHALGVAVAPLVTWLLTHGGVRIASALGLAKTLVAEETSGAALAVARSKAPANVSNAVAALPPKPPVA